MPSRTFIAAFAEHVRTRPDAPALTWGGRSIGYAELSRWADRAQARLAGLGIAPGTPLCVPAHKSPHTVALLIACFRAGRQVLLPSAELGAQALTALCVRSGCTHVLSATDAGGDGDAMDVTAQRAGNASQPVSAQATAGPGLLLTTSGSTGTPKTVVLSAEGIDRFLEWAAGAFGIGPGTRVLNYAPLNFDLCLLDVWSSLSVGACVQLVDPAQAVNGAHLVQLCTDLAPQVIQAVPLLFRLVTETAAAGQTFPATRQVIVTGDATPAGLLARIRRTFPQARLWNVYGCTETNDSFRHEVVPEEIPTSGALPIGRPIDGVRAHLVDAAGRVVTGAGTGELVVATPFQAHGYSDPDLTREKWRDGFFRTGDLARRDEHGLVFLTGRNDHQVKVRGVRTNVQEVEQVVLSHPQVLEAAVIAMPDETAGNVLHAVVRRTPGSRLSGLRLRVHCASTLPRTAIPGVIEIVDDELPRTSTGKVDRTALRRLRAGTTRPAAAGGTNGNGARDGDAGLARPPGGPGGPGGPGHERSPHHAPVGTAHTPMGVSDR